MENINEIQQNQFDKAQYKQMVNLVWTAAVLILLGIGSYYYLKTAFGCLSFLPLGFSIITWFIMNLNFNFDSISYIEAIEVTIPLVCIVAAFGFWIWICLTNDQNNKTLMSSIAGTAFGFGTKALKDISSKKVRATKNQTTGPKKNTNTQKHQNGTSS